jgi:hypothetical protein
MLASTNSELPMECRRNGGSAVGRDVRPCGERRGVSACTGGAGTSKATVKTNVLRPAARRCNDPGRNLKENMLLFVSVPREPGRSLPPEFGSNGTELDHREQPAAMPARASNGRTPV